MSKLYTLRRILGEVQNGLFGHNILQSRAGNVYSIYGKPYYVVRNDGHSILLVPYEGDLSEAEWQSDSLWRAIKHFIRRRK